MMFAGTWLCCACSFERGENARPVELEAAQQVEIETDILVEGEPGEGISVFVEYLSGGHWVLTTTCDTKFSDYLCEFDIVLTVPGGTFDAVEDQELESTDEAFLLHDDVAQLLLETGFGLDRVIVSAPPGAAVRLDLHVDGAFDPQALVWSGYGVVQDQAPSNPVEFLPTTP